jgi:hypothetical protein
MFEFTRLRREPRGILGGGAKGRSPLEVGSARPVFVLSTGRVGTETLAALLQGAAGLDAWHEPDPLLYRLSHLAYQNPLATDVVAEGFLLARRQAIANSESRGLRYVETSPQVTFLGCAIAQVLPSSKFVHLVRHPADVVRSAMRRSWFAGHACDQTRITSSDKNDWARLTAFEKNAWLWSETNRWIMSFGDLLGPDRFHRIRSEDMYAGDPHALQELWGFIGAGAPSLKHVRNILRKRLNEQRSGFFPRRSEWPEEMNASLSLTCAEVASRLGYIL